MMNAMLAAQTVDFDGSLAFDSRFRTGIKAADVYRMSSEIAFGREVGSSAMAKIVAEFARRGSANDIMEALTPERLAKARLTDAHKEAFGRVISAAGGNETSLQDAIEKSFAEDGNGVPAIAILILVLIVIVVVAAV